MGAYISRCLHRKKRSVIFLGASGSGKSTIISRMQKKEDEAPKATSLYEQSVIRKKGYILDIYDLSGNCKHSQFWKFYTENSHLVVFVVDISNRERVVESKEVFEMFYTSYGIKKDNLVFVLNKGDLLREEEKSRMIQHYHELFAEVVGVTKGLTDRMMVLAGPSGPRECLSYICKSLK